MQPECMKPCVIRTNFSLINKPISSNRIHLKMYNKLPNVFPAPPFWLPDLILVAPSIRIPIRDTGTRVDTTARSEIC